MVRAHITITLDIRQHINYGLDVYDSDSALVGSIDSYDNYTGYMRVKPIPPSTKMLTIPYRDITHVDPQEVFVSKTTRELNRLYREPPPRDTVVEPRTDPKTGNDTSRAMTREPSGYDGRPVVVEVADVGELAQQVAAGFAVYDDQLENIGEIKQYDRESGKMLIEKGVIARHHFVVPVTLVENVDRVDRKVYLAVSSTDLERLSSSSSGQQ